MTDAASRPALRPIETIVVPDARFGKVLVLRDTQGVTDSHASIPPALIPIVARFTGESTCGEIARAASREMRQEVPVEIVVRLAEQLDAGLFLEGPRFRQARAKIEKAFADAAVRPASHAGGAYHGDRALLERYLDRDCLGRATNGMTGGRATNGAKKTGPSSNGARAPRSRSGAPRANLRALVAPHIDPWRGAVGYGHAYSALAGALAPEVDTFIVFGTSHAPMREHFALCRKTFDTPLGEVRADVDAIDRIARAAPFDPYADQFNHKREHSLEFQVVFLKHVMKARPFTIVPVLAGLGEHQARGTDPAEDARASKFLDAVRDLVEARGNRAVVVAGADMAHVGPRFGDAEPLRAAERHELEKTDRDSLDRAAGGDAHAFWSHVSRDLDTRRVCGLGPIYALLRTIPSAARGSLLHYEQTIDAEDGSIVSHAALAFY